MNHIPVVVYVYTLAPKFNWALRFQQNGLPHKQEFNASPHSQSAVGTTDLTRLSTSNKEHPAELR